MRTATIKRQTKETQIEVSLNLDQQSGIQIDTGVGYFDHMLNLLAKHGRFGLVVKATGDLEVDAHHTVEDTGIVHHRQNGGNRIFREQLLAGHDHDNKAEGIPEIFQ